MADTVPVPPPVQPRKSKIKFILLGLVGIGLIAGGAHYIHTMGTESTDDAALEAQVVPMAPKVSGYVTQLLVADNQHVKAGDVLLQIDPEDYQIARDQARADLAAAQARLEAALHNQSNTAVSAPSALAAAEAQVAQADAEWQNAHKNLQRLQAMGDLARSRQSLDNAVAEERSTLSKLKDAEARLTSAKTVPDTLAAAEAGVKELAAAVDKAKAMLAQAEKNLADTKVLAPIAGRVTRRTVELGAYLQPGQQVLSLVSDTIWVVANFKETQLDGMKPGQPVRITIDAYPDQSWTGKVDSIQSGTGARFTLFPPENATGNFVKIVQRVPVKIVFDQMPDGQWQIGPGMSAVPVVTLK